MVVVGTIAAVVGGLFALREYFHSRATPGLVIPGAADIPVGGSAIFQYPTPTDPCVLIRTGADAYVAYSRICTHAACPVFYQAAPTCWPAPATEAFIQSRTVPCCRDRRRARCRASDSSGAARTGRDRRHSG